MRRAIALVLSLALSGCATHHGPAAPVPEPVPADWAAVVALRPDTFVSVALENRAVRKGFIDRVDDTTLTMQTLVDGPGFVQSAFPRAEIARVTVRKAVERNHPRRDAFIGASVVWAALGGLVGMIVGTARHDDTLTNVSAAVFFGIVITGFEMHDRGYSKPKFEDRVVYVRP